MNIRIRGTTSLSGGNDPLVIIDGVFGDLSMLNAISPSDIESLTILKDASETAQYGSRGASGVIVVTTAKGRAGFAQIEYNGLFGVNKVYKNLGMLTADEWRAGAVAMGLSTNDMGASTNWFEEVERSASLTQTHNLSFTSGNDNSNLRASLGVIRRPGLLKNSSSNSYTAKVDASQYAFQKRVKFDLGMFGSRREGDHQFDMYRTIYSAAAYNPTYPNYKNPETGIWDEDKTAIEVYNPLGMLEITNKKIASHVNVNGRVNVEIIKGLNLTGFGSYTYYSLNDRRYIPNDIQQGSMNGNGQAYLKYAERNDLMGNLQLNYAREFGRHSINALALLEAQTQSLFESSTKTSGYETNYFTYNNLKAGANISWGDATSNATRFALLSYMARFNYMYDSRYVVTANVRRDGSSKLGYGNKWGFFPSVSASWNITGEEFMQLQNVINNLRLRVGYGLAGNQNIPNYGYQTLYDVRATLGTSALINWGRYGNPDLRWEKQKQINVGLDYGMFNDRLSFTLDLFHIDNEDLLMTISKSPSSGYLDQLANVGTLRNRGIEFSINATPIRTKDWNLTLLANLAHNRNKIVKIAESLKAYNDKVDAFFSDPANSNTQVASKSYKKYSEGVSQNAIWAMKSLGIDPATGEELFQNPDGTVTKYWNSANQVVVGNEEPTAQGTFGLNLTWKRFSLYTTFMYEFGGQRYNRTLADKIEGVDIANDNADRRVLTERWKEPGDLASFKRIQVSNRETVEVTKPTSRFVQDYNWVSLNSIALEYDVNPTLIKHIGLSMLRFGVGANELARWSSVELERGLSYPYSRTINFSLKASF